jgi:hypothetical protein
VPDKSTLKRALERPTVNLSVPPPWPWYTWAVPIVLLLALAVYEIVRMHYVVAGSMAGNAVVLGMLRRCRLDRYR